jgi:hypothetical protein
MLGTRLFAIPLATARLSLYFLRCLQDDGTGRGYFQFNPTMVDTSRIHEDIFALMLEVIVSPEGLFGVEPGYSLASLVAVFHLAEYFNFIEEYYKITLTIRRYLSLRIMSFNPWAQLPTTGGHAMGIYHRRAMDLNNAYMMCIDVPAIEHFDDEWQFDKYWFAHIFAFSTPYAAATQLFPLLDREFLAQLIDIYARHDEQYRRDFYAEVAVQFLRESRLLPEWIVAPPVVRGQLLLQLQRGEPAINGNVPRDPVME